MNIGNNKMSSLINKMETILEAELDLRTSKFDTIMERKGHNNEFTGPLTIIHESAGTSENRNPLFICIDNPYNNGKFTLSIDASNIPEFAFHHSGESLMGMETILVRVVRMLKNDSIIKLLKGQMSIDDFKTNFDGIKKEIINLKPLKSDIYVNGKTKRFCISIRTSYGTLTVNEIEAHDEDEAFDLVVEELRGDLDCAKLDESIELG